MRKFLFILCLLALLPCARAQFGNFGDIPIEITADGNTRFEEGVAIAEDNVQIHYGKYSIFPTMRNTTPRLVTSFSLETSAFTHRIRF